MPHRERDGSESLSQSSPGRQHRYSSPFEQKGFGAPWRPIFTVAIAAPVAFPDGCARWSSDGILSLAVPRRLGKVLFFYLHRFRQKLTSDAPVPTHEISLLPHATRMEYRVGRAIHARCRCDQASRHRTREKGSDSAAMSATPANSAHARSASSPLPGDGRYARRLARARRRSPEQPAPKLHSCSGRRYPRHPAAQRREG